MTTPFIVVLVLTCVALLLLMVLKLKISAFISLLIVSVYVGVMTGMPFPNILSSIQEGMGGTLGFVATVVGLGAIFGKMLEASGGAENLAAYLIRKFGDNRSSWALMLTGFLVAIPVFLDVGLIILIPVAYALSRKTKKSLLFYGIPLLAGLAVTHAFIPPTPGPIAVADILGADLGWVILFGVLLGLPTAVIAGPLFGKFISARIQINPPEILVEEEVQQHTKKNEGPSFGLVIALIVIPLFLILVSTFAKLGIDKELISDTLATEILVFLGHPFMALIIATLLSMYFLCIRRGMSKQKVLDLSTKALGPAGIIILITGAGGVLKEILVDSGIGKLMAESINNSSFPVILLAWLLAASIRITQGSATVAMITAAGIIAPALSLLNISDAHYALLVISIASGATILSHFNDSGFWLVSRFFGMDEKQTLRSWSMMETIISVCGLCLCLLTSLIIS